MEIEPIADVALVETERPKLRLLDLLALLRHRS
jgi:hypothetical protein